MSESNNPTGKEVTGIVIAIACVAHETLRAYGAAIGQELPAWEDAPEWMMQSTIDGVAFHLANPKATPEDSHKNWMAQKIRAGWAYGKDKDVALKMHPCIAPYAEIDEKERIKDYLLKSNVDTLSKIFGVEQE